MQLAEDGCIGALLEVVTSQQAPIESKHHAMSVQLEASGTDEAAVSLSLPHYAIESETWHTAHYTAH